MEDKLQVLESVPVLASLGEELMKGLAERAEFVAVKKGDLVVRENDPGDALYVVVSRRLQAYTRLKSGRDRVFATYCDGECFGEMPLLSGETHWANVRALNDSMLLKIPREDFDALVNRDPRVAVSFSQRMGHRIKELREEKHRAKWSTDHFVVRLASRDRQDDARAQSRREPGPRNGRTRIASRPHRQAARGAAVEVRAA